MSERSISLYDSKNPVTYYYKDRMHQTYFIESHGSNYIVEVHQRNNLKQFIRTRRDWETLSDFTFP